MRQGQLRLKRALDLAVASTALIVLSPILVLIALVVALDSTGPVFFRQTRIGKGGKPFKIWKFRTMFDDAPIGPHRDFVRAIAHDERDGEPAVRIHKLTDDPRVTGAGLWLRRTSLDELPQLINVLRGEMSLVGPRPPTVYEFEAYDRWQLQRLEMPQGMSGLWQISGRNLLTYRRMHELDVEYVRKWTLLLDLKILAQTARAVAEGAHSTA